MTAPRVRIRPMASSDVVEVVSVHLEAFPGFFLSFLGPRFLKLFYGEAMAIQEIAIVADEGGRCVGFAAGSAAPGAFYRRLIRRRLIAFGMAALPAILRRPSVAVRVARALRRPSDAQKPEGTATLMSLGVHPELQGTGIGKELVRAFMEEASARRARRIDLTTDKLSNEPTNRFYKSLGFRVAREITTPEGRVLNEYERDLSSC